MPIEDFTSKTWTVIPPGSDECPAGQTVKISESGGVIEVQCNDKTYTAVGYDGKANKIDLGDHEIRLQIAYVLKRLGPGGGSWTAEDTPSGPAE
jgi:hypothetical protein